jgi:transcriptional regulator with XRE-family HTH domain
MAMFNKKIFGQRIKELRIENQLTQSQLADLLNIKTPTMSQIESGRYVTSLDKVYILALTLHVSSDYLLGLTDIKKKVE